MSTSPDASLQTLSWWLAGRAELADVERALDQLGELGPESSELVAELRRELAAGVPAPKLQPLVRETMEAVAHGD